MARRKLKAWVIPMLAFFAGGVFFGGSYFAEASDYTSSIPPTGAFQSIEVQTDPWSAFGNYTVTADTSYQEIHYVSDGSIWFNVTESYP